MQVNAYEVEKKQTLMIKNDYEVIRIDLLPNKTSISNYRLMA